MILSDFNAASLKLNFGFTLGMLTALITALGAFPVVAQDNSRWPSAKDQIHKFSPQVGLPGDSPGATASSKIGTPNDVTGQGFDGPPPLIVPAAGFNDDGSSSYFFYFPGGYIRSTGTGSACLMAPVYLPDGVIIENLFIYAYDNASSDFTVNLRRKKNNDTSSADTLGSVTTSGASTSIQIIGDENITSALVDNRNYSYYLTTCLSSTSSQHRIHAAWIFYVEQVFLPIVLKTEPGTFLKVKSTNTGGINPLEIRDPNDGDALLLSCVIAPGEDNTTKDCGSFKTVNPYKIIAYTANCAVQQGTFNDATLGGIVTREVFCP